MATSLPIPFSYVEAPDVPEGMTLTDYRCERHPRRKRRGLLAFLLRLR